MVDEVVELEDEDIEIKGKIIWNYLKIAGVQSKRGGTQKVTGIFCDTDLTCCSSSRAYAHSLGRPVLNQKRPKVKTCAPTSKDGDNSVCRIQKCAESSHQRNDIQGSTAEFLQSDNLS